MKDAQTLRIYRLLLLHLTTRVANFESKARFLRVHAWHILPSELPCYSGRRESTNELSWGLTELGEGLLGRVHSSR